MRKSPKRVLQAGLAAIVLSAAWWSGCGYHVAGRTNALPATIQTIAVPAFVNKTHAYRIEQRMTQAVIREFLSRASYHIISDPAQADAVLHSEITSLDSNAVIFDPVTGHATTMLVQMHAKVWLEERESKKILFHNDNYLFRQEYQISTDVPSFFDEQDPALDRMAHDFASHLVADILENF
ncbi:MAG TPA: LptE family protein [Candidatus Acidoferrales bacterium]|nr:LptE family protein [Candidatus Acidoferrales bacterium]